MKGENGLEIHVLGDLKLVNRGRILTLPPSKKTRALLAYLIATGRPHSRERLCDLLWEGPDDPRGALRWSLTKLRQLFDGDDTAGLVTDRERVAFASQGADVDITRLAALTSNGVSNATTGELKSAVALFSGEFADGLDLPACFRFHEWCTAEREKWVALRLTILTVLVERLRDTPEEALIYARSRIGIDPLDEGAHIGVIRLLTALGRQREALRQYEYCRQVLEAELGVKPSAELELALESVRPSNMARGDTRHQAPSAQPPARVVEAELVGREKECAILDRIATAITASTTRPGFVLLTGDPGIGKSRLLRYLDGVIARSGGTILTARAFEVEIHRPYGIWADLLKGLPEVTISDSTWAELQPLILDAGYEPTRKMGDRVQLFAAVVSLLIELSSLAPVAVLIDDLQWVDESSVSLLHYVIRAFDVSSRVVLAATARAGELADNDPAHRLVRGLARERRLEEIPLVPLNEHASLALATAMAPNHDVGPAIAASEGNPLFTLELARALVDGGNAVPDNIESVLTEHLSRVEGPARALLPWAAALGREFDIGILMRCVTLSPSEWNDAFEELERRGIVRSISETRYDFSHDLIRGSAYGQISQPRRRLLHGHIAQSIATGFDANETDHTVATELVRHAEQGGNHALAARGCTLAGDHCMRVFANDEAIGFAERGMHHLARVEIGPDRARLHIALMKIQILASSGSRLRRWPHLIGGLSAAIAAAELDHLETDAATGYYLLSVLYQDDGDVAKAQATTLRAAETSRNADIATAAAQLANTARCLIELELDIGRSRKLLAEANAMLEWPRSKAVEVLWSEALLRRWDGALDSALPLMKEALHLARAQEDRWRECKCLAWLAVINLERGDPEASLACSEELLPLSARMGETGELPFVRALTTLAHLKLHHLDAASGLASAVDQLRAFDSKAHLAYVLNGASEIAFQAGNFVEAFDNARDALVAAEATRRVCEAVISRAILARVLAARRDASSARAWLDPILDRFGDCDHLSARAHSAGLLAADLLGLSVPTMDQTLT